MENAVFDNLLKIYRENKFAHAYLFETNNVEACYDRIIDLIKKMLCSKKYMNNCNKCEICHLIDEGNIPSIITIEPDGKRIKKDVIENLKKTFSLMPSYIPYNIYIIKYPEKMNDTAFNKMLKFLEEPEDNIIGFYITDNKDNIASTIISRCEVLKYFPGNSNMLKFSLDSEEMELIENISQEFFEKLERKASNLIWYNSSIILKTLITQEQIVCLLNLIYNKYEQKLHAEHDLSVLTKMKIIAKYLEQLNYNVNTSLLLDSFVIEMGGIDER